MLDGVIANMIVAIELIQKAIDPMVAKKFGRIVNITSGSVKMPIAGLDLSSGARAGLTAFLAGVARTVAASNVTINFILPGIFDTDRFRSNVEIDREEDATSATTTRSPNASTSVPAKRIGTAGRVRRDLRVPLLGAGRLHHRTEYSHRRRHLPGRVLRRISSRNTESQEITMKLVRYGAPGREKPGMIDKDGKHSRPVESRSRHRRRRAVAEGPQQAAQAQAGEAAAGEAASRASALASAMSAISSPSG